MVGRYLELREEWTGFGSKRKEHCESQKRQGKARQGKARQGLAGQVGHKMQVRMQASL